MKTRLLVLLLATAATLGAAPANGRFLLIGDWGRGAEDPKNHAAQQKVADAMGRATEGHPPAAVICLGDNFYPDGAATVESPLFDYAFEKVYTAPSLQVPFWVVLGNHDYHISAQGELDYAAQRKGTGRWTMDARHWSRTVEVAPGTKAKFVFVDTSPFVTEYRKGEDGQRMAEIRTQDAAAQLAWLEKQLAEPGIAWRIVCGHHPIWSGGNHGDTAELKERLLPVLRRHKVQLYACGHDHHPQVYVREGLTEVISGNASQIRSVKATEGSVFQDRYLGFAELTLGAERGELRMIDDAGQVRFAQPLAR